MQSKQVQTKSLLGRYEIVSSLGAGGMAEVFLAEDKEEGKKVAIKFPHFGNNESLARTRFLREAKAISKLNHPNIAKLYEVNDTADSLFFVMEYIDGETLTEKIYNSQLTLGEAVEIIIQTAEALQAAHRGGFIHRDLKPSNVMITKEGTVKVLDFGLAKQITRDENGEFTNDFLLTTSAKTMSGVIVGTPMYLSPEQATAMPVDERSDVFSLGVLLYECLTGRPAFAGNSVVEIAAKVLRDDPEPPSKLNPNVPAELDRVTLKALSKKPEDRFQSAEAFLKALRGIDLSQNASSVSPSFFTRTLDYKRLVTRTLTDTLQKPRFSFGNIAIIIFIAVALLLSAYWFLLRAKEYQPNPEAKKKYDEGVALIQESAFNTATQKLREALALDPKYALAHARLAEALFELDYDDQSVREMLACKNLQENGVNLSSTDKLYANAISETINKNYSQAVRHYEELAGIYPSDPKVLSDLARALDRNGEFEKALSKYQETINHNPKYANAYLRVGELYARRKDLASALNMFEKAEQLYREENNDEGLAEVLLERGRLYNHLDMTKEATEYLQKVLEIAISKNFIHQRIEALLQMTSLSTTMGKFDKAKQLGNEAIELARANRFDALEVAALIDIGNAYQQGGNRTESKQYYERAIQFAEQVKIPYRKANALMGLYNIYLNNGQLDEAEKALNTALEIFEKQSHIKEYLTANSNFATLKAVQGKFKESLDVLNKSYPLVTQIGDSSQIADYQYQMAIANLYSENYQAALQNAKESQRLLVNLNSNYNLTYTFELLGEIYTQIGDFENAQKHFEEALKLIQQSQAPDTYAMTLIYDGMARLELCRMNSSKAIELSRKALTFAEDDVSDIKTAALFILVEAQALNKDKQKALATSQKSVEIATQLKYPYYLSQALYSQALAYYVNGKYKEAIETSLKAQDGFEKLNKQTERYKAFWVIAMSFEKVGDKNQTKSYAIKANEILVLIKQKLGEGDFSSFINRPDIQAIHKQFESILQTSN